MDIGQALPIYDRSKHSVEILFDKYPKIALKKMLRGLQIVGQLTVF